MKSQDRWLLGLTQLLNNAMRKSVYSSGLSHHPQFADFNPHTCSHMVTEWLMRYSPILRRVSQPYLGKLGFIFLLAGLLSEPPYTPRPLMWDSYYIQHFDRVNTELLFFFIGIPINSEIFWGSLWMLHCSQLIPFTGRIKHICLKSAQVPTPKAGVQLLWVSESHSALSDCLRHRGL